MTYLSSQSSVFGKIPFVAAWTLTLAAVNFGIAYAMWGERGQRNRERIQLWVADFEKTRQEGLEKTRLERELRRKQVIENKGERESSL
eukprot:Nk52_evm66s485 gene=Nk52_evmTU66s485